MTEWSDGYVSDIQYLPGFYSEQMPAHIDSACLVRGIEPPVERGAPFNYCELGCGLGETAMIVAATYPQAQVWAFDFLPAHIARGQALARVAGLDNLRIEERSFADLAGPDAPEMPLFDYVTLHGVWSWIDAENQHHIVKFLRRHVRPGGVVYISYNSLPGRSSMVPLQKLIRAAAGLDSRGSDFRIRTAIEFVEDVAKAGSRMLDKDTVERLKKRADSDSGSYLAHEYLNEHWKPVFQIDVAAALAAAKLEFAASAVLVENFPKLCLTSEQEAIVDRVPANLREFVQDFFVDASFRRDIYVRGRRSIPVRQLEARLRRSQLTGVVPLSAVSYKIDVPGGEAELHQRFYAPAFKAFADAVRTVGDVLDLPEVQGTTITSQEVIGMAIGSKQVKAAPNDITAAAVDRVRTFNLAHLRVCADEGRVSMALGGVAIGSAVYIGLLEMLAYEALALGTAPDVESVSQAALATLKRRGDTLRREGKSISGDETLAMLRTDMEKVLTLALPMWRRIGAL